MTETTNEGEHCCNTKDALVGILYAVAFSSFVLVFFAVVVFSITFATSTKACHEADRTCQIIECINTNTAVVYDRLQNVSRHVLVKNCIVNEQATCYTPPQKLVLDYYCTYSTKLAQLAILVFVCASCTTAFLFYTIFYRQRTISANGKPIAQTAGGKDCA